MLIVEKENQLQQIKKSLQSGTSFWIPMYSDPFQHFMDNHISFVYIYSIFDNLDYIIPFRHKDCYNINIERLNDLTSQHEIYVLAKKRFVIFIQYNVMMPIWLHGGKIIRCYH